MGKIIVIDGLDGCGKHTQTELLYDRLVGMGKDVHKTSFPDYSSKSSTAVQMYLHGELGSDASSINPYMCSLFYAVDRAIQFKSKLDSLIAKNDALLLCDRYLSANIIHQGSKFNTDDEKKRYFDWVYDTEVNKVGLPADTLTIVLSLPVEVSQGLMLGRYENDASKRDIHESNLEYLRKCYDTVDLACEYLNSTGHAWVKLDCSDGKGGILRVEDISDMIWHVVKEYI